MILYGICTNPTKTLTEGNTYRINPLHKEGVIARFVDSWKEATHGLVLNDNKCVRCYRIDRFEYERKEANTEPDG